MDDALKSLQSDFQPQHKRWLKATNLVYHQQGVTITVDSSWGKAAIRN